MLRGFFRKLLKYIRAHDPEDRTIDVVCCPVPVVCRQRRRQNVDGAAFPRWFLSPASRLLSEAYFQSIVTLAEDENLNAALQLLEVLRCFCF